MSGVLGWPPASPQGGHSARCMVNEPKALCQRAHDDARAQPAAELAGAAESCRSVVCSMSTGADTSSTSAAGT